MDDLLPVSYCLSVILRQLHKQFDEIEIWQGVGNWGKDENFEWENFKNPKFQI